MTLALAEPHKFYLHDAIAMLAWVYPTICLLSVCVSVYQSEKSRLGSRWTWWTAPIPSRRCRTRSHATNL